MQRHLVLSGATIARIVAIAGASLGEKSGVFPSENCHRRRCQWFGRDTCSTATVQCRNHDAVEAGYNIEIDRCVSREEISLGQDGCRVYRPEQEIQCVERNCKRGAV